MEEPIFIKILIIGDSGVGKTSLLNQYCYNKFVNNNPPTVGCDFSTKVLNNFKGKNIKLQLWDIAGQERFQAVSKLYVRGALGCVIVTDITNEESFKSSLRWKQVIEENCDYLDNAAIPIILVQNKIDLLEQKSNREKYLDVPYLKKFTEDHKFLTSVQTSAKTNFNLAKVFEKLVEEILRRGLIIESSTNFPEDRSKSISLTRNSNMKAGQQARNCVCNWNN